MASSLALVADAVHNLGDAGALFIAYLAKKIAQRKADDRQTFGYKRAELVSALINLLILIFLATYLLFEAFDRFFHPSEVEGGLVLIASFVALCVNLFTAFITYFFSKTSLNIKVAFLHNLSDALSSLAVMFCAYLMLHYQLFFLDAVFSFFIASYVLYQGIFPLLEVIPILMDACPPEISAKALIEELQSVKDVLEVHHLHVWQMDEHQIAMEAHVVILDYQRLPQIKKDIKNILNKRFSIVHSTLEFELQNEPCLHGFDLH